MFKFLFAASIFLLYGACTKEKLLNQGWFFCLKNGEDWEAETHTVRVGEGNEIAVTVAKFNEYGFLRETIPIGIFPTKTGTYVLDINPTFRPGDSIIGAEYYTSVDDGHATGNEYKLLESSYNYIKVDKINSNEIEGRFQATFINDNLPDTIHFTHGEFKSAIRD